MRHALITEVAITFVHIRRPDFSRIGRSFDWSLPKNGGEERFEESKRELLKMVAQMEPGASMHLHLSILKRPPQDRFGTRLEATSIGECGSPQSYYDSGTAF